jgi:hypothetical protein
LHLHRFLPNALPNLHICAVKESTALGVWDNWDVQRSVHRILALAFFNCGNGSFLRGDMGFSGILSGRFLHLGVNTNGLEKLSPPSALLQIGSLNRRGQKAKFRFEPETRIGLGKARSP